MHPLRSLLRSLGGPSGPTVSTRAEPLAKTTQAPTEATPGDVVGASVSGAGLPRVADLRRAVSPSPSALSPTGLQRFPSRVAQFSPSGRPQAVFGKRVAVPASARPTVDDMYHDVGMYRGKTADDALSDAVGILTRGGIIGRTQKGAQVSVNAGPTNWFDSVVSLRLKQRPEETGVLMPDDNCPKGANWYGTFSRVQIPVDPAKVELLVNGDSAAELASRTRVLESQLEQSGLNVPVVPIDRFLETRFHEIASHLPEGERADFIAGLSASPLWTRKGVGERAALMGDAAFAKWREEEVPRIYRQAHDEIISWYGHGPNAEVGRDIAARFLSDASALSEGERLVLAHRITQPYKYAVAAAMDGYERYGNGLRNALPERRAGESDV